MIGRIGFVGVAVVCLFVAGLAPGVLAQVPAEARGVDPLPSNPYLPPPCTGIFPDVQCPGGFAVNWIEQYSRDGITVGCGGGLYCPGNPVTRAEMAVFVGKAMRGTANWTPGDLGSNNTGLGGGSLYNNSSFAMFNTAIGHNALYYQSFANGSVPYETANTAVGDNALLSTQPDGGNGNLNGTFNTAVGSVAMQGNTVGYRNVALGGYAGLANISGSRNTFLGFAADAEHGDLFNATAIGSNAIVDSSNKVRIGNTSVAIIEGQVAWSWPSDARLKENIRDLNLGLDFVLALRPVSFTVKHGNGRTDMGFLAQDIEALLGDGYNVLGIGADAERTLSLRGTDLIAPLVKAIQEQQATIASQQAEIQALRSLRAEVEALKAQVAEQARQVQVLIAGSQAVREDAVRGN